MATRDKSQGFGFVYIDIAKLLQNKQDAEPIFDKEARSINLNKTPWKSSGNLNDDAKVTWPTTAIPATPFTSAVDQTSPIAPVAQVTSNLDRLSALHHKLHVLMEELNTLTKKKK